MGVQVWIARDVPHFAFFPPLLLAVDSRFGTDRHSSSLSWSGYQESNARIEDLFRRMPKSVRFLNPTGMLKTSDGMVRMESNGVSLFRDDHHLSTEGAGFIEDSLRPLFLRFSPHQQQFHGPQSRANGGIGEKPGAHDPEAVKQTK